jgi:hypothetical protein
MIIKAIPTTYHNTKFRSKLESEWAKWLDQYDIKWAYEMQGFDLENGTWYLPDFYLPEVDTFIEVKGAIDNIDKPYKMVQMLKKDHPNWPDDGTMFLLGGPVGTLYNIDPTYYMGFRLHRCHNCGVTNITTNYLGYTCRACGDYDGMRGLIGTIPVLTKPLRWLFLERD